MFNSNYHTRPGLQSPTCPPSARRATPQAFDRFHAGPGFSPKSLNKNGECTHPACILGHPAQGFPTSERKVRPVKSFSRQPPNRSPCSCRSHPPANTGLDQRHSSRPPASMPQAPARPTTGPPAISDRSEESGREHRESESPSVFRPDGNRPRCHPWPAFSKARR